MGEQQRCLDVRQDAHMAMLIELQDYYRKRSEVEMEYSRGLDKLVKNIQTRHKQDKLRLVIYHKQDKLRSVTGHKQDRLRSVTGRKQDILRSVIGHKLDKLRSVTCQKQDKRRSVTCHKQDRLVSVTSHKQDKLQSACDIRKGVQRNSMFLCHMV